MFKSASSYYSPIQTFRNPPFKRAPLGPFHAGSELQLGYGLGSILSNIFKSILRIGAKTIKSPLVKTVGKAASEAAISTGINVLTDTLRGKNLKESLKSNVKTSKEKVADAIEDGFIQQQNVSKERKKRANKSENSTTKPNKRRRKKKRDVFDEI